MRAMCLQHTGHDGVRPETLRGSVLRLHLLGFRGRIRVTGIKHGLENTSAGINEPLEKDRNKEKMKKIVIAG